MSSSFPPRTNVGDKNKSSARSSSSKRRSKKNLRANVSDVRDVAVSLSFSRGGPGDHPLVQDFLKCVLQGPSVSEFHAQLEEPLYEPTDRLLIRNGYQIVGHVRLTKREMRFGSLVAPISDLHELAVLPEYRRQGCAAALVEAAEKQMFAEGAEMGFVETVSREPFQSRGWVVCGKPCSSRAGARDILSHLRTLDKKEPTLLAPVQNPLSIRIWRHVERAALLRLYSENTRNLFGVGVRNEPYWQWLISRHGYDRIYVAINGPDKFDLDESQSPIVGYAAMKEGRIVEMLTSPEHPDAPAQILARACRDAIERDDHCMRFDAPADHPLHEIISTAGRESRIRKRSEGGVYMVKLNSPLAFLKKMAPLLLQRSKAADLAKCYDLGLLAGDDKYQLKVDRDGLRIVPGKLGRSYLSCPAGALPQLLLGALDVKQQIDRGYLEASTQIAAATAEHLFPRLPFWRPAWDNLQA